MNCYTISQKINTLAHLFKQFKHKGFIFTPYGASLKEGQYKYSYDWIVKKNITAINFIDARKVFENELSVILSKCSAVSQCYFNMLYQSYIILKKNNNPKNIFFLHLTRLRNPSGLPFDKEEIASLQNLESFPTAREQCFLYLNESTNTASYYTRLAMLIIALESIAGEVQKGKGLRTNKEYIKNEIIKDNELYNKIYSYGTGIRNKIFHGKKVNFDVDYVSKIYEKIVDYFNSIYDTEIKKNVINPQRTPFENYESHKYFYYPDPTINNNDLQLKKLIQDFENENTSKYLSINKDEIKNIFNEY
jgi:hypothetical protein